MFVSKFLLVLVLVILGITSSFALEEEFDCSHAMCHGNFQCPQEYFFHQPKNSCCYDCVLDCSTIECPKNLVCPKYKTFHKKGGRFCCDHCL